MIWEYVVKKNLKALGGETNRKFQLMDIDKLDTARNLVVRQNSPRDRNNPQKNEINKNNIILYYL